MPDSTPLWINEPLILLSTDLAIHPLDYNATWNSVVRAILLVVVLGLAGYKTLGPSFILLLVVFVIIYYSGFFMSMYNGPEWQQIKEKFSNTSELLPGQESTTESLDQNSYQTNPTAMNPFMNVLMDEIKYNPTRPAAGPIGSLLVKATLSDFFKVQWTSDPTDVFGRSQSQRQFYTMPNTSIPADRASYQNWLYLIPGKTCKEGGCAQCTPGTDGGIIPWLTKTS